MCIVKNAVQCKPPHTHTHTHHTHTHTNTSHVIRKRGENGESMVVAQTLDILPNIVLTGFAYGRRKGSNLF